MVDGPALGQGAVYVGNLAGEIKAFDERTGALRWTFSEKQPGDPGYCVRPAAGRKGEVFGLSASGRIACIDAATGLKRWIEKPGGALYTQGLGGRRRHLAGGRPGRHPGCRRSG